ncbi:unnamed protein product [Cyclocybe aegerita]|uniref:DUF7918 domain-containing protein n=1 Tax=Cyclocybe aegerita TaxID=1973307 RepID=A0A8S0W426_CYCAE|nr:unnamed protein product [Cyclocybe aegerita]
MIRWSFSDTSALFHHRCWPSSFPISSPLNTAPPGLLLPMPDMPKTRLDFGDYSARVKISGREIEHHSIKVDEEKKLVSCWIASEEGKAFAVDIEKLQANYPCSFYLFVDGDCVTGRVLRADWIKSFTISGTATGSETEQPFLFSRLELTDDDSFLASSQSARDIGEIKVEVQRVSNVQKAKNKSFTGVVLPGDQKVHERVKKATEHRVKLGQEVRTGTRPVNKFEKHEKVATFIFRYCSLGMLQANGLAKRDLAPLEKSNSAPDKRRTRKRKCTIKEESENEREGPEEAEARREETELLAQLESIRARLKNIRNARDARNKAKPPGKKIKQEPKPVFLRGEGIGPS